MTLNEKFDEKLTYLESKSKVDELEKIADDFAIEFSKFIEIKCEKTEYLHQYNFEGKEHYIKSLLEIFKKEKGL